jgi:hypothetical protein
MVLISNNLDVCPKILRSYLSAENIHKIVQNKWTIALFDKAYSIAFPE